MNCPSHSKGASTKANPKSFASTGSSSFETRRSPSLRKFSSLKSHTLTHSLPSPYDTVLLSTRPAPASTQPFFLHIYFFLQQTQMSAPGSGEGAAVLAEALHKYGIEHAFGIVGVPIVRYFTSNSSKSTSLTLDVSRANYSLKSVSPFKRLESNTLDAATNKPPRTQRARRDT